MAKLIPYQVKQQSRKPGSWKGKVKIAKDFDGILEDLVKFLLDTHVLLWCLSDHKSLTTKAAVAIKNGENAIFVSAITAWENSIKRALGKLKAPDELEEVLESNSFQQLPIPIRHGLVAGNLPRHHDDPFDPRLIA